MLAFISQWRFHTNEQYQTHDDDMRDFGIRLPRKKGAMFLVSRNHISACFPGRRGLPVLAIRLIIGTVGVRECLLHSEIGRVSFIRQDMEEAFMSTFL